MFTNGPTPPLTQLVERGLDKHQPARKDGILRLTQDERTLGAG